MIIIEDYMRDEMHLSGAKLFVYAALCGHVQNGFSTVTQEQLAAELGLGLRTVTRAFAELRADKFIKIKPFRDNGKKRNMVMLNDIHLKMNQDVYSIYVVDTWNIIMGLKEGLTIDIFKKIQKIIEKHPGQCDNKNPSDFIGRAIANYSTLLNDEGYYKSHVYKLSAFLNKIEDYSDSGCEWKEYLLDVKKRRNRSRAVCDFNEGDRPLSEQVISVIDDNELGNVEM